MYPIWNNEECGDGQRQLACGPDAGHQVAFPTATFTSLQNHNPKECTLIYHCGCQWGKTLHPPPLLCDAKLPGSIFNNVISLVTSLTRIANEGGAKGREEKGRFSEQLLSILLGCLKFTCTDTCRFMPTKPCLKSHCN